MDAYSLCGEWNKVTLCKDLELMQSLAITTLDSTDLLLNFEAARYP